MPIHAVDSRLARRWSRRREGHTLAGMVLVNSTSEHSTALDRTGQLNSKQGRANPRVDLTSTRGSDSRRQPCGCWKRKGTGYLGTLETWLLRYMPDPLGPPLRPAIRAGAPRQRHLSHSLAPAIRSCVPTRRLHHMQLVRLCLRHPIVHGNGSPSQPPAATLTRVTR